MVSAKIFAVEKSDISSDKADFGAVLANDNTFYFTSARNDSRKTKLLKIVLLNQVVIIQV